MTMTQPQAGTAQAAAPSAQAGESFHDRMLAKLAAERPGNTPTAPVKQSPASEPEEEENIQAQDQQTVEEEASAEPEEGASDEITTLRAEIERLSNRERELTADYTRKTQRIAEARRQIEQDTEVVRNTARHVASVIDAPVRQFENIPWSDLQTQDPAKYQTMRAQYEQTVMARNNFLQSIAAAEAEQERLLEENRQREAELSKDILRASIPNWSNETYLELRKYAETVGFQPQEFDRNTDYRLVLALHKAYRAERAATTVKSVKREPSKTAPSAQNKPQIRSVSGQFANARQALSENRGDRNIARQMFQQKLASERKPN